MPMTHARRWTLMTLLASIGLTATAAEPPLSVWPDLAPGETSREPGTELPRNPNENPPITRVVNVRRPTIDVFLPDQPNGTALLVLPGGGFGKIVPDMEGSEAAPYFNKLGIAVFVLRYRTNEALTPEEPPWKRPLQDAQRSLRLIRSRASEWNVDPQRVGVLGFSAGGQVASILHTAQEPVYEPLDVVDQQSCRPDFSLLIYPWRVYDEKTAALLPEIRVTEASPPAFLVHTHDDASTSLGAVMIYAELKRHTVPAELHVYENGGHGYGTRARPHSNIGTWPDRAVEWLVRRGLGTPPEGRE